MLGFWRGTANLGCMEETLRHQGKLPEDDAANVGKTAYEPPRVERVLAPEDLEREILYAGTPPAPTAPVPG